MTTPPKSLAAPAALRPLNLHVKTLGAIAEHLFTACALSLGFMVSKPVVENSRYDLILDLGMHNVARTSPVRFASAVAPARKGGAKRRSPLADDRRLSRAKSRGPKTN